MANLHEIKARIDNVNATKKITRAMYLISTSKSQKAKSQLNFAFPYFQQITATMAEILACSDELDTPFINEHRPNLETLPDKDLYLILGADKGMAGSYSYNVMSTVERYVRKDKDELLVAGLMSRIHLKQMGYIVDDDFKIPVMNPTIYRAREVAEIVARRFLTGDCRSIYVIYTEMVSSLKQEPRFLQLLPLDVEALCEEVPAVTEEIEYLPGAREVFDHLVPHYLKGIIYGAFVEAFASEQFSRMYAMDNATKSANETIDKLSLSYNRARQAKITQELTEIIGGIPEN